jgi:hypothetical protein
VVSPLLNPGCAGERGGGRLGAHRGRVRLHRAAPGAVREGARSRAPGRFSSSSSN